MANQVPLVIADFESSLSSAIAVSDTSFTLASATDDDGNALAAGKYCFTINNGSSTKQYLMGQLNGTSVTSVVSVDRRGNETSGAAFAARAGAPVIISDFATIQRVADILRGQETLDGDNPIVYDAEPTLSDRKEVATVAYVLDNVAGGTVNFDNQIISSSDATAGETIAAGDWVFFQTSDQEWYKIDADTAAEVDAAYLGVALGAGTDGASITGGVQISGVYTTTGLTAGDVYYLSNTAGAITNSAGTTERAIGVALSTTKLLMNFVEKRVPTADEKDAMAGGGDFGTPSSSNKFLTQDFAGRSEQVTFNASGTWTKDTGLTRVRVQAWGGGGSGGSRTSTGEAAGGGGGGGYAEKWFEAADLGATETVTVGAGGTGVSGNANGNAGASTTFGSLLTAYGGGRGGSDASTAGGGGGGGSLGAGGNGSTSNGTAGSPGSPIGGTGDGSAGHLGGGGGNVATNVGAAGGDAYWGGAGGGGAEATSGAGGTSIHGGNGGAAANGGSGTAGTQPGGGGGGSAGGTSGAGGDGRVIVTEFYT